MAGEEKGGVFAFIVLTIALSVAITQGIALAFFKTENNRIKKIELDARDFSEKNSGLTERNRLITDERDDLKKEILKLSEELERMRNESGTAPEDPLGGKENEHEEGDE